VHYDAVLYTAIASISLALLASWNTVVVPFFARLYYVLVDFEGEDDSEFYVETQNTEADEAR
jgi:hypothetical protein